MGSLDEARALDGAIDRLLAGTPEAPSDIAGLVAVASGLREAIASREPIVLAPARSRLRAVAVGAVAAILALLLLSGTAFAASSGAVPGSRLYPVKAAFERLALHMRTSEHGREAFAWTLVTRRLTELRAVAGTPAEDRARAAYEKALARAEGTFTSEGDGVLLDQIEVDLNHHVQVLTDLLQSTPTEARAGLQRAIDHAAEAQDRVRSGRSHPSPGRGKPHPVRPGR